MKNKTMSIPLCTFLLVNVILYTWAGVRFVQSILLDFGHNVSFWKTFFSLAIIRIILQIPVERSDVDNGQIVLIIKHWILLGAAYLLYNHYYVGV